jgi:hypothetical protein
MNVQTRGCPTVSSQAPTRYILSTLSGASTDAPTRMLSAMRFPPAISSSHTRCGRPSSRATRRLGTR